MISAIKRLILLVCILIILAFIYSDGLLYYVSKWHEKTGEVKKAVSGYRELLKKYPNSKWKEKARRSIQNLRGRSKIKEEK